MKADLRQEWECRSKWNIILREIIDMRRSVFYFDHVGLPIVGETMVDTSYFILCTVGLYYHYQYCSYGLGSW